LLVKCVRKIAAGEIWIDNLSVNKLIDAYRLQATTRDGQQTHPGLAPKELAVITCITEGKRNKEIAHQLGTTEQVIKNYLRNIYVKLGVADRIELALYGLGHELHKRGSDGRFLPVASGSCADVQGKPNGIYKA
jgi:two-component system, NarL family, nitrate/nitrite response regulator NarL